MRTLSTVRSLDRGLRILELFSRSRPAWTVAEIARELGVPLASAYRLTTTLQRAGYLEQARPRGPLRLGLRVLYLGSVVQSGIDTRDVARPVMRSLAAEVGDTTMLAVPGREAAVCVEHVDGFYPIRPHSLQIGDHLAFHAGAVGLALLAHMPPGERARLLAAELSAMTQTTLVEPIAIEQRCAEIRRLGFAYTEGETIPGTAALAVPIFGVDGQLVASLCVTGIVERFRGRRRRSVRDAVISAGEQISRSLGHLGATEVEAMTG
jgi:DNA-binding IclR family transcriptional regulator